jgi:hypothetical protein
MCFVNILLLILVYSVDDQGRLQEFGAPMRDAKWGPRLWKFHISLRSKTYILPLYYATLICVILYNIQKYIRYYFYRRYH